MRWSLIRTVARLELLQRRRTSRWPIILGVWFVLIGLVTYLTWLSVNDPNLKQGSALYDVVTFLVLGLAMLIMPSLTATSINGDREQGVLATMQTTLVGSWDLVLGKLLAAWIIALTFLVATAPFLIWGWIAGELSVISVFASLGVLLLVLAVTCSVGLMFSTLTARPVTSAVLTYLVVAVLAFGTAISFGLASVLVTQRETVRVKAIPDDWWEKNGQPPTEPPPDNWSQPMPTVADCRIFDRQQDVSHTEQIWWLLPANPFVLVADTAPTGKTSQQAIFDTGFTPMRWISDGSRLARAGEKDEVRDECSYIAMQGSGNESAVEKELIRIRQDKIRSHPVWPIGLGFWIVLGVGTAAIAERRVRTPVTHLPSGTRIA